MSYPKTTEEWWTSFDGNKADLRRLVETYHPATRDRDFDVEITAPAAERVCEEIREQIVRKNLFADPKAEFDKADKERDGVALASLLNKAWFGMPECMEVRSEPSFGVLCDLCSESYLVQPNGEFEEDND